MKTEFSEKQLYIMDKALSLFVQVGYHKASVRAVAKAAGVNVAMIFYYFGSKEKLLEILFDWHLHLLQEKWNKTVKTQKEGQPLHNLNLFVDGFSDIVLHSQNFYRLMMRQTTLLHKEGFRFSKIAFLKNDMVSVFKKNIDQGIASGIFNENVDPEFLMQVIAGTYFHMMIIKDFDTSLSENTKDNEMTEKDIDSLRKKIKLILKAYLQYGIK